MTSRYRCPFCGTYSTMGHLRLQQHFIDRHPAKLLELANKAGYGPLEAFDTRKPPNPPRNGLERHSSAGTPMGTHLNRGVSGEGDT